MACYGALVSDAGLANHSIRTLAWLGDAEFERDLRLRIARRGDWPTGKLDRIRARLASANEQARLFGAIEEQLSEEETDLARRARNTRPRGTGRGVQNTREYRTATALEALVAHWWISDPPQSARFDELLGPHLERAIDLAIEEVGRMPAPDR
jgi:ribonuclease-3 family protein